MRPMGRPTANRNWLVPSYFAAVWNWSKMLLRTAFAHARSERCQGDPPNTCVLQVGTVSSYYIENLWVLKTDIFGSPESGSHLNPTPRRLSLIVFRPTDESRSFSAAAAAANSFFHTRARAWSAGCENHLTFCCRWERIERIRTTQVDQWANLVRKKRMSFSSTSTVKRIIWKMHLTAPWGTFVPHSAGCATERFFLRIGNFGEWRKLKMRERRFD